MRAHLESAFLALLLIGNFVSQAPALIRQGAFGLPPLIFGFGLCALFLILLFRCSAKGALVLSLFGFASFVFCVTQFFVADALFEVRPTALSIELRCAISLAAAFSALDLWSQWRKTAAS